MTLLSKMEEIVKENLYGFSFTYTDKWTLLRTQEKVGEDLKYVVYYFDRNNLLYIRKYYE